MITLENYDFSDLEVLWIADRKRSTKIITSLQYKCQQRWLYQDTRRCRQLQWLRRWRREWWWWYWWYDKRFRYRQLLLNHDRRSRIYNFNNFVQNNLEFRICCPHLLHCLECKPNLNLNVNLNLNRILVLNLGSFDLNKLQMAYLKGPFTFVIS